MSDFGMYDTDDFEQDTTHKQLVKKHDYTSEILVGDQKVMVVNPAYIEYVNAQLAELQKKCQYLESELRNERQLNKQKTSSITKVVNQISSRVGF